MTSFFSVSGLFVCEHFPALLNANERLWEEQIVCFSCCEEEIFERSVQYFKSNELEYKTENGKAKWNFYGIIDIFEISNKEMIANIDTPIEIFSRHLREQQAKELCKNNKIFQDYCCQQYSIP